MWRDDALPLVTSGGHVDRRHLALGPGLAPALPLPGWPTSSRGLSMLWAVTTEVSTEGRHSSPNKSWAHSRPWVSHRRYQLPGGLLTVTERDSASKGRRFVPMPTETQWGHRRHPRVWAVPFRGTQDALPTDLSLACPFWDILSTSSGSRHSRGFVSCGTDASRHVLRGLV